MSYDSYLETAVAAARLGGEILSGNLSGEKRHQISKKQQFDFVTQVDLLSEKAIIEYLRKRHPEHDILAEESGGGQVGDGYLWVIDPLDGTKNYIHNFPFFAVSVALLHNGQPIVGAVFDPTRDELFCAQRGGGAFLNSEPIRVSTAEDTAQCLLATGFPFRAKHLARPYFEAFVSMFHEVSDLRRAGAAALDLSYVACGRLDGFWEVELNLWDIAAGVLLIEEAGGEVSGFLGRSDHLQSGNIIASNGKVHTLMRRHTDAAFSGTDL